MIKSQSCHIRSSYLSQEECEGKNKKILKVVDEDIISLNDDNDDVV